MTLPALPARTPGDCWNHIGVWGDHSCPELNQVVHCHNCPVFATASRRFLDAPPPDGYLEEWTERLIAPIEETSNDRQSILIFRLGEEWLALRVQVLLEVTTLRPVRCIPHRAGLLAGLVNIRGELHLCLHLTQLLGIEAEGNGQRMPDGKSGLPRMIVVVNDGDRWVFPVDEVDQVYRLTPSELSSTPATLARSAGRLTKAILTWRERSIGYLDDERLFRVLRSRIQ
ncbi:MAG TPA: chemotaxis protein CheW [Gemmataceae bacterium]|nr:chemotaxis protein CheW [Gemmataceae bacterium]